MRAARVSDQRFSSSPGANNAGSVTLASKFSDEGKEERFFSLCSARRAEVRGKPDAGQYLSSSIATNVSKRMIVTNAIKQRFRFSFILHPSSFILASLAVQPCWQLPILSQSACLSCAIRRESRKGIHGNARLNLSFSSNALRDHTGDFDFQSNSHNFKGDERLLNDSILN
jgi:hypothetical protein